MDDLFLSLEFNKFYQIKNDIQGKLEELIACRHDYPMWPVHGDNPFDTFEEEYHGPIRHIYYSSTLHVLRVFRMLKELS